MKLGYQFSIRTKQWYQRHVNDIYVREAKRLRYRSRAAFKLLQLNDKYKLIGHNSLVLDLGSAPGGWSQVCSELTQGVYSVDLVDQAPIEGVTHICGDIRTLNVRERLRGLLGNRKFDCIISDMAPNFCGFNYDDHSAFVSLNNLTMALSIAMLRPGGSLILKSFNGADEDEIYVHSLIQPPKNTYSMFFMEYWRDKPLSSRSESSEFYMVGKGFKAALVDRLITKQYKSVLADLKQKDVMRDIIIQFDCL